MALKKKKFVIIDGNAILHRAWHALPPLTTEDGKLINAAYGFTSILLRLYPDLKPDYLAVAFDRREPTFRKIEYKEYKAQRVKQPDELYAQLDDVKNILDVFKIPYYDLKGYEADDIIATLVNRKIIDNPDVESIIVTGDMDALQLVDHNTKVYALHKGISETITYNEKEVREKFNGLGPEQMIDYKALRGDPSDNIPGVPGIGEKTAIDLLNKFDTLENLYDELEKDTAKSKNLKPRVINLLKENKKAAFESKRLVTLVKDTPIKFKLSDSKVKPFDLEKVSKLFQKLQFKTLMNRLEKIEIAGQTEEKVIAKTKENLDYRLVDTAEKFESFLADLKKQNIFAFDTETDGLDPFFNKLLGVSFSWHEGKAYYVIYDKERFEKLKSIFKNQEIKKVGHNLKFDFEVIEAAGLEVKGLYFDTMIASYLLNPGSRGHNLNDLAFRELGHQMIAIEELIGKGKEQKSLFEVAKEKVSEYSCEDADISYRIYKILEKRLKENGLFDLLEKMEMPLIYVLAEMEKNGVLLDLKYLKKLSEEFEEKLGELEKKIYKQAGEKFNINSPLQLKVIFFEKLKLPTEGLKKTKTGISTAAGELEKLLGKHAIIELIVEYRELTKLKSTYIDALPRLVKPDGRVHTSFNQTITATGRLSSSDPNLQNIPKRTTLGMKIRKAFIAAPGSKLVSSDYSQVELRVVACLAKDENMIEIFKAGHDIHTATAAKIHGVKLEDVTKDMRREAKMINFGILYGMGAYGLAARTGISIQRAKEFIDKYYRSFSRVQEYMESIKEFARENGYTETMFGRKRYFPDIHSGVQQIKAAAEREAINTPIQGTAADLIKIAMIEVYKELKKISPETKMLLQVHDELVFEVPEKELEKVAKIIDEKMEKIHKTCVPITVETDYGDNWRDLEKLY
ncbi:MAG TPA: DNA polymerase I [Candidatus Bipolaricaulota bacterium]|nr:DNA polymerase I [Candidatus Bipolaricaulota bacterium]